MTITEPTKATFADEWQQWHDAHERALADPHGFLAVTSLHWLTADPQRFDDAPGTWTTGVDGVTVLLDADEVLVVDGVRVHGDHCFGTIAERESRIAAFGDAVVEVAKRCGYDIVRPRHPENELRKRFIGTPTYPPSREWQLTGRFVSFDTPRPVTVGAAVEGLQHVYDAPGEITFSYNGQHQRLIAFNGKASGSLLVLFTDATSGVTTYGANRVVLVDPPDAEGRVVVDFNRATNLPCAYTDHATCPLPPAENRLTISIEAGELLPYERR